MDIRQILQDLFLLIFIMNVHPGLSIVIDEDYEDVPAFNRCPWIRNKLKNGRVKYRYRGRVAKFICDSGFELAGKRSSTCVRGQWSNPLPVCVARGCSRVPVIANGRVTEMYRGALLVYDCIPGYSIEGAASIHCDGRRWNTSPPLCSVATETPEESCDFENPDLCGWSHDPNNDFDWRRNQHTTPSGHAGTGPSYDHTFGENKGGYYLYIEASSPRKINDTARIFSPVYFPSQSGGCFLFYYHMYGATTGGLKVYLKPESHVFDELSPVWEKFGDQGNQWLRGDFSIPRLHENFQIVIEGIRGESYVGDSAIDDVILTMQDCASMENETGTVEKTIADSCRGRCKETDSSSSCDCNENCYEAQTCCRDYATLCYEGNDTSVQVTEDPIPGYSYGKTSTLVTMIAAFTTANTDNETTVTEQAIPISASSVTSTSSTAFSTTTASETSSITMPAIATLLTTSTTEVPATTKSSTTLSSTSVPYISPVQTSSTLTTEGTSTSKSSPSTSATTTTISTTVSPTTLKATTVSSTKAVSTTVITTTPVTSTTSQPITTTSSTSTLTTKFTTEIPHEVVRTTLASKTETMVTALPVTPTTAPSTITERSSTSQIPDISTISSTRKTYNLRPRSTTPGTTKSFSSASTQYMDRLTTNSTLVSTTNVVSSVTASKKYVLRISATTPAASSRWHDSPVTLFSTAVFPRTTVKPTTVPTTPTTYITTSTQRYRTTSAQSRTQNTPRKFTFRFKTSTLPPLSSTVDSFMGTSKSETPSSNGSVSIVISLVVISVICIAGGIVYYMRKQRGKRQSKLADDSELRFLEENDHMEYSDASALDKILVK